MKLHTQASNPCVQGQRASASVCPRRCFSHRPSAPTVKQQNGHPALQLHRRASLSRGVAVCASEGREGGTKGEAPNFWASKPAWCQPWTILASGSLFIAAANKISSGSVLVTIIAAVPIVAWWFLFLILVPSAYAQDAAAFQSIDVDESRAGGPQ